MIVPQYWAEGRLQHRSKGRQVTVRRFGWSDVSQQEAQAHADARTREAFERVLAGEPLQRREDKRPYNGAVGVPIREEIIARDGDSVITRNSYGALCLNTPHALFVDIDFEAPGPAAALKRNVRLPLLAFAAIAGVWAGSWWVGLVAAVVAWLVAGRVIRHLHAARLRRDGGPEAWANARVEAFTAAHPDWSLRQYRTPAGLRVLVTHRPFDPAEPEVEACFKALQSDPVYAVMCVRQHCFRARVSPKPWRIGIDRHLRPRPGTWPIKPERMEERRQWVADYERRSEGFAACRYERTFGEGRIDPGVEPVRALHDRLCRAESALPLA
ncbi:hypothetical protein [Pseudoxanthomonas japonensis]|uniref:hypothetical protein n=1 Tax=Pseudoxanthomonas japonensis TaxID=69284 RepID=UPI001BCFE405|nr:hypothetical protein [Pseudoxanthomonas japonensis]